MTHDDTHLDPAAIALHLRGLEAEAAGAAYLKALALDRQALLAVAGELLLTRMDRLNLSFNGAFNVTFKGAFM